MMPGFANVEEVVEEVVVEEPATAARKSPWPTLIAVGSVGFIGLGLLYGMSRASGPQASRYAWGGVGR